MTVWTCATCAIEHADTAEPPAVCAICTDERQFVPAGGQKWTRREELAAAGHRITVQELETDLYAIDCEPRLGIGQRGLLVCTRHGNLLWEPPGFIDDAGVAAIGALGGIDVITASHPHLTGASIQWSHAFGRVPVYVAAADQEWIRRPDPVIRLWDVQCDLLPGVRMHQCGGHFPGSSVVHWSNDDDDRRGALLTGDTVAIGADRTSVNAMRSYVNNIPLSERSLRRVLDTVMPLDFDRIYSAFGSIGSDARPMVDRSLRRYVRWIRGELDD